MASLLVVSWLVPSASALIPGPCHRPSSAESTGLGEDEAAWAVFRQRQFTKLDPSTATAASIQSTSSAASTPSPTLAPASKGFSASPGLIGVIVSVVVIAILASLAYWCERPGRRL